MDISIKELGAVGDGRVKNTEIIQRAIDICSASGSRVIVSDGVYLTGRLTMRSNVELHIAAGATLLGSPDYADYPEAYREEMRSSLARLAREMADNIVPETKL